MFKFIAVRHIIINHKPWRATITLETTSGIDAPAAINVRPITLSGIDKVCPENKRKNLK